MTPEEKRQTRDSDSAGDTEVARPQTNDDPQHADGNEQGTEHRMRQEADQILRPVGRRPPDLRASKSQLVQRALNGIGAKICELVLKGFLGRQREELAFFIDTGNHHIRVDHRLRKAGRPLAALSGRAEFLPYIGDRFLCHGLCSRARLSHLHRHCRPDGSAPGHDEVLGGQADKSAGRDGALIHEGDRAHLGIQQRIADQHCGIHPSSEGIDLQNDGRRTRIRRFIQDTLNEWRQSEVDDAFDGRHINDRPLLLGEG